MHYPNCPYSIDHFRRIKGEDADVAPGFQSELGRAVSATTVRAKRKGDVAGRVAVFLMALHTDNQSEVSLSAACHLTADSVRDLTIDGGKAYRPSNPDVIRKAFYEKKDACHLWAVSFGAPDLFVKIREDEAALRDFLDLAAVYEFVLDEAISAIPDGGGWDPWRVPQEYRTGRINLHMLKDDQRMKSALAQLGDRWRGSH